MSCCNLIIIPPRDLMESVSKYSKYSSRPTTRVVRSGTIIMNFNTKKILIIQCYGKLWGLPKGQVEQNESTVDCAIRETFEETGIRIKNTQLIDKYTIYNGDGIYYTVDGTKLEYELKTSSEITGISWICMKCLKHMIRTNRISINSHLRFLLPTIENELNGLP